MGSQIPVKVDMKNDGILWLINRTVFHPRGFALSYDDETKEFFLIGNGKEPWAFGINEDPLFEAVEHALRICAYENRPKEETDVR